MLYAAPAQVGFETEGTAIFDHDELHWQRGEWVSILAKGFVGAPPVSIC